MKAWVVQEDLSLQQVELAEPQPGPGQVRVQIQAAAVNKRDYWISVGKYPGIKPGVALGSDGAGVVDMLGEGISKDWLHKSVVINPNINWGPDPAVQGDDYQILGMPAHGTFAEYVVVDEDRLHLKPDFLPAEEAAALPLSGLTAFRACFYHGKISAEKNVLVTGFGGGVAHYAFMFARAAGASVSVTSGKPANLEKARQMGATHAFDYREADWVTQASMHCSGFDVIIDSAGGKQFNELIRLLKPAGRLVFYGATNGLPDKLDLYRLFWKQITIQGSTMGNDSEFAEMLAFVADKQIRPMIRRQYPFEQTDLAIKQLSETSAPGKVVVVM